jgi:cation diffusion facilitator CzcD-associated flavoprotein CzcO
MSPDVTAAIIGTGFGGIGMAVYLKKAGVHDIALLERAGALGGTWRDNSYPGAECDVPSNLYSFSFAPNPRWSRSFSPQPEIRDYLRDVAARYGVTRHIRFNHEVRSCRWDDADRVWRLDTSGGPLTARFLISATGPLSDPSVPDIPGLASFTGAVFHSARWDHDLDLTGRSVAVIGTGASAIQFVPRIQPKVASLSVFQRTPPWIVPRRDRRFSPAEQWMYEHLPVTQQVARKSIYWAREGYVLGFAKYPPIMRAVQRVAAAHLHRQVKDPALRAALTPDYRIGCKRILLSSDYYPALVQPNVHVVTRPVTSVTETGVRTDDGAEHQVDTIIFGTGFHVADMPIAQRIEDAGGVTLAERRAKAPEITAFRGTTFAGFPNLFMLTGPNTGLGHSSQVFMIEAQIRYAADAIRQAARDAVTRVEVQESAQADFSTVVGRKMSRTVWVTGGCRSWYLDASGRNVALWPDFTWLFALGTRKFDAENYNLLT